MPRVALAMTGRFSRVARAVRSATSGEEPEPSAGPPPRQRPAKSRLGHVELVSSVT